MNTWKKRFIVLLGFLLLIPAVAIRVNGQEDSSKQPKTFYYSFDKKIYGRLDTSILAVQAPKGIEPTAFKGPVDSMKGKFLSEDIHFVKAFQQEGIIFIKLDKPVDIAKFKEISSMFLDVSPAARVGHPFFINEEKLPRIVTNEFIVRFKTDIKEEKIKEFNQSQKVEVVKKNPHVNNQYLLRVTETSGVNALEMANRYQESGLVVFSQPNFLMHLEYYHIPSDPNFSDQWHLHNQGGSAMTVDADIDAVEAWDITRGDPDIIIAVIDGGFEITHPDLDDNFFINAAEQRNGLDDDGNTYIDDINGWSFVVNSDDVSGGLLPTHGQPVAGLVAAEENNITVVGVAPQCRVLLICNTFNVNALANAFYYARDRGADIITNSWGSTGTTFEQPTLITAIDETANGTRGGRGISIFFATGNDGGSVVAYPARDPNTIAIGGSDCTDVRYNNSQYGPEINVVAPTKQGPPDYSCGLVTTGLSNGVNTSFGGTSGATPIAAGIAGLLLSVNPNLTRQQVQQILQETAEKIEPGVANYDANGFSNTHGYGRVNAHRAVVPTVKISVSPKLVWRNKPFSVKVTSSAPFGLKAVWWFGDNTGIPDIDQAHWKDVEGAPNVYIHTWEGIIINKKGKYKLGANARDIKYPTPGDGYPHQASEGSGIDYAEIKVVPTASEWAMALSMILFMAAFVYRKKGSKLTCISK